MGRESDANDAKHRQALLDAAATARLFDRFGRPVLLGGEYEFHDNIPPVYMLQEATPDLRREARPGMWILTMTATLQIAVQAGQRTPRLTLVQMPAMEQPPAGDPDTTIADSDAPAGPSSSIILTDMDKTARATLGETEPASSEAQASPDAPPPALSLVPPPADHPAYDALKELETMPSIGDLQSPSASTLRGEES